MRTCIAFLVFYALFVSGCAANPEVQYDRLNATPSCCADFSQFDYKKLEYGAEIEIEFGPPDSLVYDFPSGKSYFVAFELPTDERYVLHVKSAFNGMMIGQFFDPVFIFLDDEYQKLGETRLDLSFVDAEWSEEAHMVGRGLVLGAPKYAVVLTQNFDTPVPEANLPGSTSVAMAGNTPMIIPNPAQTIELTRTPTGKLKIEATK